MITIVKATIFSPDVIIPDGTVIMSEGIIQVVGPSHEVPVPEGAEILDGQDLLLAPGFIDLQVNGGYGHDFTLNPGTLWQVAAQLPRYGVTTFLPTIVTSPLETAEQAQEVLALGPPARFQGALPLGLHLEGPFLNRRKKGAHNQAFLRRPSLIDIDNWSRGAGVWLVTLAPELIGADRLTATLVDRGVVVSAGHSLASFDEAKAAFEGGLRYCTHLFNAMPALHHREPGLAGAALADERITIGLIADGLHVHPSLVKLVWQLAGDGRLNLVSDAMAALGMPPGRYRLGELEVTVDGQSSRLADDTLAGCVVALDGALRNLLAYTGCSLSQALTTVTTTPAAVLGVLHKKGRIAPGYDADLVLLDSALKVERTLVGGRVVYSSGEAI